jgi:hypothetical protein
MAYISGQREHLKFTLPGDGPVPVVLLLSESGVGVGLRPCPNHRFLGSESENQRPG